MAKMHSDLVVEGSRTVVICKPSSERFAGVQLVVGLSVLILLGWLVRALVEPGHGSFTIHNFMLFGVCFTLTLLIALARSGPVRLRLDGASRRYTVVSGLPFKLNRHSGNLSEIDALVIKSVTTPSRGGAILRYLLRVEWKEPTRRGTVICAIDEKLVSAIQENVASAVGISIRREEPAGNLDDE